MVTNEILPFCPTNTGTNLLTQVAYAAADDRDSGNKPGVASSKLNNKVLRQSAFVASQIAQYISDRLAADVLDDGVTATLLAQIKRAFSGTIVNVGTKTTTYTILNTDDLLFADATGGAFTMTLPAASANPGKIYYLVKKDSSVNAVTIARAGSDTINGLTSTSLPTQFAPIILVSDGVSKWTLLLTALPRSEVYVDTSNTKGSAGGNSIDCYQNIRKNSGTAITYASDAVNGDTFTINEPGIYTATVCLTAVVAAEIGISVNASSLTQAMSGLTYANGHRAYSTNEINHGGVATWTGFLTTGDVVRSHGNTSAGNNTLVCSFTICQVSK